MKSQFKYIELLACSLEEFEEHLISKFTDNMTMDNYGEWEIDHIKPVSKFDFSNLANFYICFNYKNLQPLWKIDNQRKYNKE